MKIQKIMKMDLVTSYLNRFVVNSFLGELCQGVSYSKKFRVKHGFPNYLEVAISQFGSAKK
jgi:hypothetical protein